MRAGILTLDDFDFTNKTVILRVDINSPIDPEHKQITNDNRIRKCLPTIKELSDAGARIVMLAHQGDTEDYQNLISLEQHADRIAELLARPVAFIDDIAGPMAMETIRTLSAGEILLLTNVRYLTEEVSTFVNFVKILPTEMSQTRLVRNLAPLAQVYVCEAFSAAHRYSPSLIGFAEVLPSAGGRLFIQELEALTRVKDHPVRPCVHLLGGARIADAFSMMKQLLAENKADYVLTSGLNGEVMLLAQGYSLGEPTERLIQEKGLTPFIEEARKLLTAYGEKVICPIDFAINDKGRKEITLQDLPSEHLLIDIGAQTLERYQAIIQKAATIFVNGPPGIYEEPISAWGTEQLFRAVADSPGYSVIGGGDSVAAATRFKVIDRMGYVCTSGGGMVRFLSGQELPVITALRKAALRDHPEKIR
jgi:phosphoglycerate kinase